MTRERLLFDLYIAFYDAKRFKSNKPYVKYYERNLEKNLKSLCDRLYDRTYSPGISICFIIHYPKPREVYAADFEDRIVHHLYYNYTSIIYNRTFIADTYSCIVGRGTHYGVKRLQHHIRQESLNYTIPCFALKMDIKGYFMNINRNILLDLCLSTLNKARNRKVCESSDLLWQDIVDFDFVLYLTKILVLYDPTKNCIRLGDEKEWECVPKSKLLSSSPIHCGLPIGNLTSQLFSNVNMNVFDQFVKRILHCKHYGRYVDDFYFVSCDRQWLTSIIPVVTDFLHSQLGLEINQGKTIITSVNNGVEFLGAYVKPWRTYISNKTLQRMIKGMNTLTDTTAERQRSSLNSYCGVLRHHASMKQRYDVIVSHRDFFHHGCFNEDFTKFIPA